MDQRTLEQFIKQLREELVILDRIIANLERLASGKPRRGRPPRSLSKGAKISPRSQEDK
jgi:hypothetical protein